MVYWVYDMSDDELKPLLEENLALTKEVHRTMRSVRRYIMWGRILDTVKFLFVIGALAGAYFFIQPYLLQAIGFYRQLLGGQNRSEGSSSGIQEFLKNIKEAAGSFDNGQPTTPGGQ